MAITGEDLRALYNKRKGQNSEDEKEKETSSRKVTGEDLRKRYEAYKTTDTSGVDQKYIDSFINDANAFLTTVSGKESSGLSSAYEIGKGLNSRADSVGAWLYKNRNSLDQESYNSMSKYLDEFKVAMDYFSQWETEEDYKNYLAQQEEYNKMLKYDLGAGRKEIDGLKDILDILRDIEANQNEIDIAGVENYEYGYEGYDEHIANLKEYGKQLQAEWEEKSKPYGGEEQLRTLLAEKEKYYSQAERLQTGVSLTQDALKASDFEAVSNEGNAYGKELNWWEKLSGAERNTVANLRNNPDQLELYEESAKNANGASWGTVERVSLDQIAYKAAKYMTDEEFKVYNYYYAKDLQDGTDNASKFLESIEETLNSRQGTEKFKGMEGNAFLEYIFGVEAGLDQFESGMESLFSNKDYIPMSGIQYASGMVREDLADVGFNLPEWMGGASIGQVGYDMTTTTANMLPSILVSFVPYVGQVASPALLGASAAGNAKAEMLRLGYSQEQATSYGLLVGASESVLQYALGGISALGGKVSGNVISKVVSQIDNGLAKAAITLGGNMVSEGVEEALQSILEPYFKSITTGEELEAINWEEVVYSGLLGTLSAGILEGGSTIAGTAINNYQAKQTYGDGANLVKATLELNPTNAFAQKMQAKVDGGKSLSGGQINRIVETNEQTRNDQNIADIASALQEKGMSAEEAMKTAEWLYKATEGETYTRRQQKAYAKDDRIADVHRDLFTNEENSVNKRNADYEALYALAQEVSGGTAENAPSQAEASAQQAETVSPTENAPAAEKVTEGKFEASETGKTTYNGTEVKVQRIASTDNGEVMVQLDNGEVVNARDVEFGSQEEALIYEAVADMDADTANDFIHGFNSMKGAPLSTPQSFSDYQLGFNEAQTYGELGIPFEAMSRDGKYSKALVGNQAQIAYNRGRINGVNKAASARKVAPGKADSTPRKYKGETHVSEIKKSRAYKSLSDTQKAGVAGMTALYKALGINVYFFESPVDSKGKRHGKNGYFNPEDNSVHIDLYAGIDGRGLILFTGGHELTHYIRANLPTKFKAFADILFEQYEANGTSVTALIAKKRADLDKRGRTKGMTEAEANDLAYEEVVADACEAMLGNGEAFAQLSEKVKAKDEGLWNAIKKFFTDLVARIKSAYAELSPDSIAGQKVAEMLETATDLQKMWVDMLVEASDVHGVSMEVTANDAMTGTDVSDITKKPVQKLQERTEYQEFPKEMIKITSSGAERTPMDIEINGKKFVGSASVRVLRNARFAENKFDPKYVTKVNQMLDKMRNYLAEARVKYTYVGLTDVYNAKIIISPTTGQIVLSGLVNNGDYEINFDFTKTCKKRIALQDVIEQLAREKGRVGEDGIQTEVDLSEENIRHINEVLAANGIETACLCCFVDSKRYAMQAHFQEKVCDVWNRLVDEVNAEEDIFKEAPYFDFAESDVETSKIPDEEYDKLYADVTRWRNYKFEDVGEGEGAIERKMKAFLINTPDARKKLRLSDFITEAGRTNLHKLYPDIESLAKAKIGTALPKAVESFAPYNGEIELLSVSGKEDLATYVKNIAGARSQSFSDFIMAHVYDVLQKTASLTARKLTAHTYTKEISRARLFGMTGEKTNLSVLHEIDPDVDSWNAGFRADGSYFVSDYEAFRNGLSHQIQSIPDRESIALQNDPRYSRDCGRIGVGFSYNHMLKMHNDPDIRQVIGYHTSSLPAAIKPLTNLDKATDYTPVQNTLKFKGFKKPNYDIPDGVPSYATPPQDVETAFKVGKNGKPTKTRIPKYAKSDATFDIKGKYEELCQTMDGVKAAKETLRQLLQFASDNGLALETSKYKNGHADFDLYGDTEATQNPYLSADNYIEYCISQGLVPMFYEFALNDNYYKDIYDFNVFDRLSYNPETGLHEDSADRKAYAPQVPVHMMNEDGSMAFPEDFWDLVDKYMKDYNYQREDFAKKFPKIMREVRSIKDSSGKPMVSKQSIKNSDRDSEAVEFSDADIKYSIREEDPPKKTMEGYKVFVVKNGKLYPPMVANPNAEDTPVGVWLNADVGTRAPDSKTGRMQVKAGGKGTQGGSGSLAFRPGWHLGETPLATQFDRLNPETGVKELFPENFVWALCDIAADHDYQEEAMSYGYTKNGKFQHSLAGLPKLPTDGYYKYRTNPNPDTVPWLITGAMKVKKLLSDAEVNAILVEKGLPPKQRVGGDKTLADLGLAEYDGKMYSDREIQPITESETKDLAKHFGTTGNFRVAGYLLTDGKLLDFSGKHWGDTTSRSRQVDHRDVGEVLNRGNNGFADMVDMIGSGNIRLMPEIGGINLAVYPNEKQRKVLSLYINYMLNTEGQVIIDYDAVGGDTVYSREYGKTATSRQILTDIRNYFNGARQSELMQFHTMYSDRDTDSVSNRSLLANALESVAQNDIERAKLAQYKDKIALIESEQAKLAETKAKIKELSFAKGRRDTEAIKKLQFEANQSANRINTYDRQLLNLEATAALKGVLQREKQLAYKKAEKEGKEALAKYREKAANTQRELLTRYQESRKKGIEGRKKTEMRHKIKNVVNELNQYLLKGTKEKHVPIELQKAVAEALDAVNMDTVNADERIAQKRAEMLKAKTPEAIEKLAKEISTIREMGDRLDAKLSRLKTAYDSIINSDDSLIANSHDDVISSSIDKVVEVIGDTPLRDMSLYQLEAVYDLYKMVLHSIRAANKAFKAAKGEEISTIANGVIAELDAKKQKSRYSTKAMQEASKFDWNNLKPVYAFERIGSANFTKVFNAVRAGEDVWAKDMSEAQAFREDQFKKYKYDSWDFKKRYRFTSTSGKSFELSLDQILSLYAFSKRAQAGDHLKYGGFVFDGLTEVKVKNKVGIEVKYNLKDATAYNLSEQTLAEIIDKLTPEQKEFADAMQDYLSTVMGEKGNEVSLELYDIKLFKEKNYFPLKSAPQYLAKAKEQAQGEVKIKNSGFTKETSPKAKNPIVLSSFMDVWAGHVNEMSMYHAFTLPLEDFYRVYNYHTPADEKMSEMSVSSALENAHRPAAVQYIDQLLKDLNGGARSDPRETLGKAMMSNFKKASVMASMSVVVQQPTAIVRAMAIVNSRYFIGKPLKQKHKVAWAEVKKYAPVAVIKEMGYFDTGMGQGSVEWLKGDKTIMTVVDDVTSKLPSLADEVTWVAIWNAVKRETVHNYKHLAPNSDAFLKVAGERFTEVITKTQVYDSTLSRSANMRSKSVFMNMATSFMAEPTTSINMLQDAFLKGNKKYIARTMAAVYGSVILNSALVSLVYAMRDDDEDETFLEKYLSRFTTEVIDGINPLTYIPFVKDIWSIAQGFDVERADMALITDLFDSFQQMVNVISKDTSDMDDDELADHKKEVWGAVLSITDNFSSLSGLPVKNIRRDINGVINFFKTIGTDLDGRETTVGSLGDNILEDLKDSVPVWGWFPDESKGDKLYDAIIKGDTAYIDRLKSGYKSEESYHTAVKKIVRERYEDGEISANEAERILVANSDLSAEEASSKVQYWAFKKNYPDYELSEEAVAKYYTDVEPMGINMNVYYDYYKQKSSCKGTDDDGDGRADSGTKKAEIMEVIDSLPITNEQKDALYYLNGWSEKTLWEAPWH